MKILITGSSGFIGNKIFADLDCCGQKDKLFPYDIKTGDDIRDRRKLDHIFETENFDIVVHCAALTGVRRGEEYPEEYIATNVLGTKNIVDMCDKYDVDHLINFSSSSIYFQTGSEPVREEEEINPHSIYGMTKLMAEHIAMRADSKVTTIRPFTVFGENGRQDQVIQKWINQINAGMPISFYGDGRTGRGYTFVDDLVRGVRMLIDLTYSEHHFTNILKRTYNIGGDLFITLDELVDLFKEVVPNLKIHKLPLPKGDNMYNLADTSFINEELGWQPECNFNNTLKKIIKSQLND